MDGRAASGGTAPIFIIGAPRSGTTLLRMMLDSHRNISCGPETHFLAELHGVAERNADRVAKFGVGATYWDDAIRSLYEPLQVDYMRRRGKQRWAEKTPSYTLHLDFIDRLFPTAVFAHIIRDGRDVVASHGDRWGYRSAVQATGVWGQYVTAARDFGRRAPERYHELRYEALVTDAEATLRPLFDFLGEPWDPTVLAFDSQPHDAERYVDFTAARRAQGGQDTAIYTSRVGAGSQQLDPFLRRLLRARSGGLLDQLGYSS